MLTEEQIKNLKPGDPIVIPATFHKVDYEGDIWFNFPQRKDKSNRTYIDPEFVSLPGEPEEKPKYDPCRLFREGDIVQYIERDGRFYSDAPPVGATCRVCVSEDSSGMVNVEFKFSENEEPAVHDVPFYHLELITPIEELEPYKVWDTTFSFNVGVEDTKAVFYYGADMSTCPYTKEQAKAAAEAECARLNAEYRKEQK